MLKRKKKADVESPPDAADRLKELDEKITQAEEKRQGLQDKQEALQAERQEVERDLEQARKRAFFGENPETTKEIQAAETRLQEIGEALKPFGSEIGECDKEISRLEQARHFMESKRIREQIPAALEEWIRAGQRAQRHYEKAFDTLEKLVEASQGIESDQTLGRAAYYTLLGELSRIHPELAPGGDLDALRKESVISHMEQDVKKKVKGAIPGEAGHRMRSDFFGQLKSIWWEWRSIIYPNWQQDRKPSKIKM